MPATEDRPKKEHAKNKMIEPALMQAKSEGSISGTGPA